jgi:hypothetical protein
MNKPFLTKLDKQWIKSSLACRAVTSNFAQMADTTESSE